VLLGVAAVTNVLVLLLVVLAVASGRGIEGVFVAIALATWDGFVLAAVLARKDSASVSRSTFRCGVSCCASLADRCEVLVITIGMRVGPAADHAAARPGRRRLLLVGVTLDRRAEPAR